MRTLETEQAGPVGTVFEELVARLTAAPQRAAKLVSPSTPATISGRVRAVCAGRTCAEIAAATGYCAESVRRYRRGDSPPAGFVACLARAMDVSVDWLLLGRGPRQRSELVNSVLGQVPLSHVLKELSDRHEPGDAFQSSDAA